MYSIDEIRKQIDELGIPDGAIVLMHTSLRAVGAIEGGAEALLDVLINNITSAGGLFCVPTHTWDNLELGICTLDLTKHESCLGAFPNVALLDPRGIRSHNPTHSMVVFGNRERALDFISGEIDVKTPTSPQSCYGKLADENGYVLLVGVDHNSNTYLHSVEEMLDLPSRVVDSQTRVSIKLADGSMVYRDMYMFDESVHGDVSHKFYMYEPAFRYHGAIKDGYIGAAPVQLCSAGIMKEALRIMADRAPGRDPLLYEEEIPKFLYEI